MKWVNEHGVEVRLGPELARAGEGVIHEVTAASALVAKLYHKDKVPDLKKATKLQHLCRVGNTGLLNISAWPQGLLYSESDRRTVRGFLMPRIQGKEIHHLYGPRDRQSEFPSAAWDFLIHVARNCAAAFETLHEHGVVMADVNEKNLLVTSNGLVRLIDCDSYQFRAGNTQYLCEVGVPMWTPPELQRRVQHQGYHGLERTPNHDRFGLAVLIFELLFMGRHPFAGVPDGHQQRELHVAIQEFLFAFSPQVWQRGLKAPPHTLPLGVLPQKLVRLFERAFLPGSERPDARPSGREWAHELDALHASHRNCSYDPGHKYWNGLANCPWCHISGNGGPNFFISVAIHAGAPGVVADVAAYWATILRIISGPLMGKSLGVLQLPAVTARPLPIARPIPPRLSKPEPPSPPTPIAFAPLPPPQLPELQSGPLERDARTSIHGMQLCMAACLVSAGLGQTWAAVGGLVGTLLFLVTWVTKREEAMAERHCRQEAAAKPILEAHRMKVLVADVAHSRAQAKQEEEYRAKLSTYSAQLSLYENAHLKQAGEVRKWEQECNARAQVVEQTRGELDDTQARLRTTLASYRSKVLGVRTNLESAYQRYQTALTDEGRDMRALETKKQESQRRQFLGAQLIRNHRIKGIGPVKAATLVGYGIESALDITPTMNVTGVGPALLGQLLRWRMEREAAFRYNPRTPLPPAEVQAVKLKYAQVRQAAIVELRGGAGSLTALETETQRVVNSLESKLPQLARAHAQALADHGECLRG